MFRFKELIERDMERLARVIIREHGKVLSDARGEIVRGLEVVEYACGIPELLKGEYTEQIANGIDAWTMRQATRCLRRHHAVQFPRDGPDVDVSHGARLRQHLRA